MYFYIDYKNKTFFKSPINLKNKFEKVFIKGCTKIQLYTRKLHKEGYVIIQK